MRVQHAFTAVLSLAMLVPLTAAASLDGTGSILYLPVVADTSSYTSQVTVRNPYTNITLPIAVTYTGGDATAAPGVKACTPLSLAPLQSVQFSVRTQCSLPSGGHFGVLKLEESYAYPSPFFAYSRSQTPGGNGFSVPAYPAGGIEAPYWGHYVVGLARHATSPTLQTNCFVATTGDASPYAIQLFDGAGVALGNPVSVSSPLAANQMVRILDIFAAAGLPAGDYSNVTAQFSAGTSKAALISFCTVQESTSFGADFRMAQPRETLDGARQRDLVATSLPDFKVTAAGVPTTHDLWVRHPDRLRCQITSGTASVLEIRLFDPNNTLVAGGANVFDTLTYHTGSRALYGGFSSLWHVEVSARAAYAGTYPVAYDLVCFSGNGSGTSPIPR